MRKNLNMMLAFSMALLLILSVSQAQTDPAATEEPSTAADLKPWVCPEGFAGQRLNVYNWASYIGSRTISDFEALCGVSVTYDVYESNETLIARIRQGNPGYDVAFPQDYAVAIMIRDGLIQPINLDNIPNFANVADEFKDLEFDPGNQYSVPYLWGTTGIGINTARVTEEITSWRQLFEYDGRIAWVDDVRVMMSIALLLLGHDPNSVVPEEVEAAQDFLIANGRNVVAIAADDGDTLLAQGEVDMAIEYNGDIYQVITDCACDTFIYVIPDEGTLLDISSMVILRDAPNPALAEVFMDYILHPQVSADLTNETFYSTPNQAAIDLGLVNEELLANPAINPPPYLRANFFTTKEIGDAEELYNDAWDIIKISVGR